MMSIVAVPILALLVIYPFYFIVARVRAGRAKRQGPMLVTLLAWLGVLMLGAAVVIPQFLTFALKSKQSPAKQSLAAIYTTQRAYFSEKGEYAGGSSAFTALNWEPEGYPSYAYYCGADIIRQIYGSPPVDLDPKGNWPFPVKPSTTADAFTCLAVGNLDNDPFMDVWSVNDRKEIVNVLDDVYDRDTRETDPRLLTLYVLGGVFALFIALIVVDVVRIGRGKRAGAETVKTAG